MRGTDTDSRGDGLSRDPAIPQAETTNAVDNHGTPGGCPQRAPFQQAEQVAKRDNWYGAGSHPAPAGLTEEQGMTINDVKAERLTETLRGCPPLAQPSAQRDALWLAVQELVCTRGVCFIVPMGSSSAVHVTAEHSTDELLAAMEWLTSHEDRARGMAPQQLFIMLRGVATRGAIGSARAAQADALHGMTHVSPGDPVVFADFDMPEVA